MNRQITSKIFTRTILATATVALTALAIGTSTANAGGKRHFGYGKFYKNPYKLKHEYICEPQYITTWVYSKRLGKKVRRTIRIEDRCNVYYH
jgi:hypothetical protein